MSLHLARSRRIAATLVATLSLLGLLGCGSDKTTNPPPAGSTTFTGTVAGTGVNGKLTITIATSTPKTGAVVTATGTYTPTGGAAIGLTGNYDDDQDAVVVANAGATWTFGGLFLNGHIDGVVTGPGNVDGYFALVEGSDSEVTVIVGRYDNANIAEPDGEFSLSINGTVVHGGAVADGTGDPTPLDGSYNPTTGAIAIDNPKNPGTPLATGTYNATTGEASGTFDDGAGGTGTWSGTRQ